MKAKLNMLKLVLKNKSPELLLGGGMALVVAGGVIACKNSPRIKEKIDEYEGAMLVTDDRKEQRALKIDIVKEVGKAYGLPVVLTAGGFACIIGGHRILRMRNVALAAGLKSLQAAYNAYDANVREKYGDDIADKLKYGVKKVEGVKEGKDGKEKPVKYDVIDPDMFQSPWTFFFDESSCYFKDSASFNMDFLRKHEKWVNDRMKAEGILYVNDVLKDLDIPTIPLGQMYGWRADPEKGKGDGYISFRLVNYWNKRAVNGFEPVILIELNPDLEPLVNNDNLFERSR